MKLHEKQSDINKSFNHSKQFLKPASARSNELMLVKSVSVIDCAKCPWDVLVHSDIVVPQCNIIWRQAGH